jgi:hypothetical protein
MSDEASRLYYLDNASLPNLTSETSDNHQLLSRRGMESKSVRPAATKTTAWTLKEPADRTVSQCISLRAGDLCSGSRY